MRIVIQRLLLGLALLLTSPAMAADTMQLWITVDWEGLSLDEDNLQAMQRFRQQFPDIPMLHLVNPVYFIQPGVHRAQVGSLIRSTFLPQDTVGLHLHPMRTLVEYCGLTYQATPSISGRDEHCRQASCGHSVSLEFAYSETELTRLVHCSSDLMVQNGFNRPRHFRAGAWQLGPKLQAALVANGFYWDSSRIDARLLTTRWPSDSPLIKGLQQLHAGSTPLEQPYALSYQLMEYPDNAALADYTNTQQLLRLFEALLNQAPAVMVLGFHQESAADYLLQLERAIPHMQRLAKQKNVTLVWMP
ncbi:hypothetical protein [Methylophilus sp. YYY-1]|uniref:Polysaccharide deacetylase n=1 Tax=Methylophilus glucosoxydans TaxID=752553 RepID=A0ABW3GF63_9PROT|nr:hypothetical protein [Methylophilus sp. YYY-1]MDF0379329.1 hypothetical protein [Methylophilus sp. YYY-1]